MARLPLILMVALAAVAGCSQNDVSRKVIAEQCIAEGGTIEVCEGFAKTSAETFQKDILDIIVLGAQGEGGETEKLMQELSPSQKAHFTAAVREVITTCGGEGYLAGS